MCKQIVALVLFFLMALEPGAQNIWKIEADSISSDNYYGATVANGQIGLVSSPEPLKISRVVLGGVYDIYGNGRVNNFVNGINMLDVELKIDGSLITQHNISNYIQAINMYDGLFEGRFDHKKAHVEYCYTALRNLPYSCMMKVTIIPNADIQVSAENIIKVHESMSSSTEFFTTVHNGIDEYNIATTTVFTPTKKIEIGASSTIICDTTKYERSEISHLSNRKAGIHSQRMTVNLHSGEKYTFYILGSTISSLDNSDVRNELERLNFFLAVEGPERLMNKHLDLWHKLWESDIQIDGDAQSQQDIHNMLFNLYGFVRENSGLSLSPMGLSGFGYNGHVFWDSETWVFPALLLLHPEMAKTLIDYRYNHLDAAKRNAYIYGYKGAKFPWESSSSGYEDIPPHNLYGAYEIHINADIAIAAWQYYQVTKDMEWLKAKGYPIIKECADFWVSRAEFNEKGGYDLINVIGADERNINARKGKNVNNNAYTIGAAVTNLKIAEKAAAIVGQKPNAEWKTIADGLNIVKFENGLIREHDDYIDGALTKQIDVGLLIYPLGIITDKNEIKRNLDYYIKTVPRKTTPAMSKSVYSIIYSQIGEYDNAWNYFKDSYIPNLNPPFRVIAEFDGGTNPYFITGAGGTLQSVLMGFCGLRITDRGIVLSKSAVPSSWSGLIIKGIGPDKKTYRIK